MAPAFEVVARLPLGHREPLLNHAGTRFARAAGVAIGKPMIAPLAHTDLPPSFLAKVDLDAWNYVSVRFPFDLEEASRGFRYLEARYEVALTELEVTALQLGVLPMNEPEPAIPEGEKLLLFGLGQARFKWLLRASEQGKLTEGSRVARAVIQTPPDLGELRGEINVAALLDDLGVPGHPLKIHQPEPLPFALDLKAGRFIVGPAAQ
ncbi:hypothetical protein LO762_25190 [Actinocorallia sp. API 0066]|uniref:hypothetical protein n=1 Tax=Actinocorallia sp. API 0066 TaxID=2896846 RepID=UPI001E459FF9|nr:hypothetical protein [Actinocorallia sp. API 0066]MCD0452456.1 hypothetical protein [Actinocorallia sp. API 0066]